MPVSPLTTAAAPAHSAASRPYGRPPASTSPGPRPAAPATRATRASSPGPPVTTTRRPRRRGSPATAAYRSGGQRRAPESAPGWRTTAPGAGEGAAGAGSRRSPGSAGMPYHSSSRHQRSRSCSSAVQRGPWRCGVQGWANTSSRPGRSRSSSRWLDGPRPCRSTATSGGGPVQSSRVGTALPGAAAGSSRSTAPLAAAAGSSGAGAASTASWSGKARRSARSAGTR